MKKTFLALMAAAILSVLISLPASAITIGFQPATQDVTLGDSLAVNLVISDLGDYTPPSLSTFDLNVLFDPAILTIDPTDSDNDFVIDSVVIDPTNQLDLWGFGMNLVSAGMTGAGILNIYDLSFDTTDDLNNFQAGSFTLATIAFDAVGPGTSGLAVDPATMILGDAAGDPLFQVALMDGTVNVTQPPVAPVPEPATCLLMGAGLAGLFGRRRRKA